METLQTVHLLTLRLQVAFASMFAIGTTVHGRRRIASVTGGTFEGERLRGVVVPGGADWVIDRPDGMMAVDVRLPLQTDDGKNIYLSYSGLFRASRDVMSRFNRGEILDESEYVLRTIARFETGAERYAWLNDMLAIGKGQTTKDGPIYTIFEIL